MTYKEPRVQWPDPDDPQSVTRDFMLARDGEKEPVPFRGVELIILVNRCLYVVVEDSSRLKAGEVLWRNLDLTERRGGSRDDPASEQFIVYKSLNHARRAAALIDPSYREVEDPDLRAWLETLDWMVRTSWSLHRASGEDRDQYEWVATDVATRHGRVRNDHKVHALRRSLQAASIEDSRGRSNPTRLPLICFAGEREIRRRLHQMRGISRRMSWRQVVLEHYIDRLREITMQVSRSAQHRAQSSKLFGGERTNGTVKREADRMEVEAAYLRALVGRPFSHTWNRVADDMTKAVGIMREAAAMAEAGDRNGAADRMPAVPPILNRIYRSVKVLDLHWRLEELMVHTSRARTTKAPISELQKQLWHEEIRRIHRQIVRPDPVTCEAWDQGFTRPLRKRVMAQLHLADEQLMAANGPNIRQVHEHLKAAVSPF